jgi:predicted nucleic acid-binding protein
MSGDNKRFTLDTNILVYAIDSAAGVRHRSAAEIVPTAARLDCVLTLQAISEFYAVATRKGIVPPPRAAGLASDWIEAFPTIAATREAVRAALGDASAGRASYWDALLVATAAEAGCAVLLTEDMRDGATLGGVRIHNPFSAAGGLTEEARGLLGLE